MTTGRDSAMIGLMNKPKEPAFSITKMNISQNNSRVLAFLFNAAFLLALLTTVSIRAGTTSVGNLPATGTDAATGISTNITYLCCLAFGSGTGGITINSVPFQQVKPTGVVPPISGTDTTHGGTYLVFASHNLNSTGANAATGQADGQTLVMLNNVIFEQSSAPVNSAFNITCGGLTNGASYVMRLYYRKWVAGDTRPINVAFNGEGTVEPYAGNPLNESVGGAHYIEYDFTAATSSNSVTAFMSNTVANESVMISGLSLQYVPPALVAPTINTQPVGFTNWAGWISTSLTVGATGNPAPTYQWYQNNTLLSGATTAVLTFTPLADTKAAVINKDSK